MSKSNTKINSHNFDISSFSFLLFQLLDELQFITMTGCNTTAPSSKKTVFFKMVDSTYTLQNVSFSCDASAAAAKAAIAAVTGLNVHVTQVNSSSAGLQTTQVCPMTLIFC